MKHSEIKRGQLVQFPKWYNIPGTMVIEIVPPLLESSGALVAIRRIEEPAGQLMWMHPSTLVEVKQAYTPPTEAELEQYFSECELRNKTQ